MSVEVRDRSSNMIASSVNAPMKKGGAGGAYTWGSPMDVTDYMPVGPGGPTVTVGQPQYVTAAPVYQQQPYTMNAGDFPTLGGATIVSQPATAAVPWAHASHASVSSFTAVAPVRAGTHVTHTFDGQHPRHQFARVPRVSAGSTSVIAAPSPQLAVDWSSDGTTQVAQTILTHAANPGHAALHGGGPYVREHPATPLQVLRSQPAYSTPHAQIMPKMYAQPAHVQYTPRPMKMQVMQGRGR